LVGNNTKNINVSDKNIYLRRQTAAVIESSVLGEMLPTRRVKIKTFYIIYVVWKTQIMLVMRIMPFNAF